MPLKRFVGVDLHTDNFAVCIRDIEQEHSYKRYPLTLVGLEEFKSLLSNYDSVAVEAVANASYFRKQIIDCVESVIIFDPGKFQVIGKSYKKTDFNDAKQIALYHSKNLLPAIKEKTPFHSQFLSLLETRSMIVRMRMVANHKVGSILIKNGIKVSSNKLIYAGGFQKYVFCHNFDELTQLELDTLKRHVEALNERISTLDKKVFELATQLKGFENITSIHGIGTLSAAIILCSLGDINDFPSPKKLASYFGLVPKIRQSNNTNPRCRITKRGSKMARTVIVTSVWQVIRYNPNLRKFYDKKRETKEGRRAAVATASKLLGIIYHLLKHDMVLDKDYKFRPRHDAA